MKNVPIIKEGALKKYIGYISILIVVFIIGCGSNQYKDSVLGMTVQTLDSDLKNRWSTNGVVIVAIEANSPAEKAGLKEGELISYVVGERDVNSERECEKAMEEALKEDRTAVIKFSDGKEVHIFVKKESDKLGYKLDGTKVVEVEQGSPAYLADIKVGDQIKSIINKKRIRNLNDYEDAIDEIKSYNNSLKIETSELVNIKLASLSALGKLGDPRAIEPLISAMQRDDVAFRLAAAESLDNLVSLAQFDQIFEQFKKNDSNKLTFDELLKMSNIDRNKLFDKIHSAERLGLISYDSANKVINLEEPLGVQFKRRFDELNKEIHSEVVLGLVRKHFKRANEPDQEVRRYCMSIIAKLKSEETIDDLIQVIKDSSEILDIRFKAGLALSNIGKPSIDVLISALSHEDTTVKSIAATSLGEIGGQEARTALTNALAKTDEPTVKLAIAQAFAKIGDSESIKILREQKELAKKGTGFEMFISELLNDIGDSGKEQSSS